MPEFIPKSCRPLPRPISGHAVGYGDDPYTAVRGAQIQAALRRRISKSFIVFNGTAANCLSLKALTNSYHAVICAEAAHIYTDECGAPEKFTGCKLIPVPVSNGKLTVEAVSHAYHGIGDQHHVQPRVISITQATEVGTVYQPAEIKALARFAHERGMFLHMDGARIANAAASLGQTLRQATRDLGVDVLSFGGTKNGALGAEAVVFFDKKLGHDFLYLRKQGMQLASKMRFISAQFDALFTGDLWLKSAQHANRMARLLQKELTQDSGGEDCLQSGSQRSLRQDSARRDCQAAEALLLLCVERAAIRGALDVLVRYHRAGCEAVCPVRGADIKGLICGLFVTFPRARNLMAGYTVGLREPGRRAGRPSDSRRDAGATQSTTWTHESILASSRKSPAANC